jgi:hypothetical protein
MAEVKKFKEYQARRDLAWRPPMPEDAFMGRRLSNCLSDAKRAAIGIVPQLKIQPSSK